MPPHVPEWGPSRLAALSLLMLALGLVATVWLPGLEGEQPSALAANYTSAELRGRAIFQREGCWYCHTQQVRAPEVGRGTIDRPGDIGPESAPGDYARQQPVFWGTERQGPDLSHVASRAAGGNRAWQLVHLRSPSQVRPGSTMPSYAHLPDDELEALVDYLLTLK
ncbi:MAG: cbb3-type cytochrome c oxidase subunit II [Chloroflexi bacterium]|nr:cbb3-type cytochrome c oxidase subunit II [Chloroflexota bacterium]